MCNCNYSNNQLKSFINSQLDADIVINDKDLIPFNIIVANNGFTFNNGTFIANSEGTYMIVYHINIEGSTSTTNILITILKNGISYHTTNGNALVGQFSGSTALTLRRGDTIQLINDTGEEIEITFANITIFN